MVKGSRLAVAPSPSSRSSGVRKMLQAYSVPRQSMVVMPSRIINQRPWAAGSPNSRLMDDDRSRLHCRDVRSTLVDSASALGALGSWLPLTVMPSPVPGQLSSVSPSPNADWELRQQLVAVAQRLSATGLNHGTAGNLSARWGDGLLITPSSLPSEHMEPHDLVAIGFNGRLLGGEVASPAEAEQGRSPSSEWRLHADVLRSRPDAAAVVHCHSIHATALACHGRGIPPFHYMVVQAGGPDIRCAGYATFGSQELSDLALAALQDRQACLLAHHGQVSVGASLEQALALAVEVETLAHQYLQALQLGEPPLLSLAEMERVAGQMQLRQYGALSAGSARSVPSS